MSQLVALFALLAWHFGGWAVVTVKDLPDRIVAGQPLTLEYTVRQHGRTLLSNLRGRVVAELRGAPRGTGRSAPSGCPSCGTRVSVDARPGSAAGTYTAALSLPQAGEWTITVYSGFMNSNVTLLPLPVVTPGQTAATVPAAERGRRLFVAKGCLTCHVHPEVPGSGVVDVGPDLTGRRFVAGYLERFLADPDISPIRGRGDFAMPDLGLAPAEIAALAAFLDGAAVARSGQ